MKKDKLIGIGVNGAKVYESSKKRFWHCRCDCGRIETFSEYDLLMGIATMCSVCKSKEEK